MSEPILLGERVRIEVPNATPTSGNKHDAMAWTAQKNKKSGNKFNVLSIGTKHSHFAQLTANVGSELCDLVSFKTKDGSNVLHHDSSSSDQDDVLRYGVAYALRCLTRSKAGGRYLSPNNDNLAWDRHGEALRTDATKNSKQAEEEDEGNDPAHHNEMFRVIHLVASNMLRDWQEDVQAAGNPLVPTSRFGLVHEGRLEAGKPAFVAASADGTTLQFVADLGPLCVFVIQRVSLEVVLNANDLLSSEPVTENTDSTGYKRNASFVGESKEEDGRSSSISSSASTSNNELPTEFIECQSYSYSQWVARKNDLHFCTVDNQPMKMCKKFVTWWTADGLSHWRVALDAIDNDGDGEISTDMEGWMYGSSFSRMFHKKNPSVTPTSNHKYRIRKWEKVEDAKYQEWHPRLGTSAGELNVPRWRINKDISSNNSNNTEEDNTEGTTNGGQTTTTNDEEDDDDDGGFQHAPLTPSPHKKGRSDTQVAHDDALELAYLSLAQSNGTVTKADVVDLPGWEEGKFEAMDQDGDGNVTLDEFKAFATKTSSVVPRQQKKKTDISTIWAGQALLPIQQSWEGRVIITSKWMDANDTNDYSNDYSIQNLILSIDDVNQKKKEQDQQDEKDAQDAQDAQEKKDSEDGETKNKGDAVYTDSQKQTDSNQEEVNQDYISKGRIYTFADVTINKNTKKMILKIKNVSTEESKEDIEKIIDLNQHGISIASITDSVVAANSLDQELRMKSLNAYNLHIQKIKDLQLRRKQLPPNNKTAKSKINEQINQQIVLKIQGRDQMLGRQSQQGWLQLKLYDDTDDKKTVELLFSPIENESSFISSENEGERGKKENFQNNYEIIRSIIIDSLPETNEMRSIIQKQLHVCLKKLASMKQFTTTNGAADLFQQFNNDTNGMAEIDERIDLYQQEQRAIQGRIKIKIQEIESGNLSLQLANGLKDWVLDIQETNKMSEDAAIEGLKLLQEQVEGLETMSDDIIDAAKKQAILTLQYGVPYLPNGSDQWRKDLEAGKSDETLKKLTSNMTKQVAAVTGVPETVVNASIESKTGVKTGPSIGDQMTSGVSSGVSGVTGMFNGKQESATENGDVEMVAVEINDQDEIKNAEIAPVEDEEKKMNEDIEVPITSEQASLLAEFRAPKQPEEYWYENHMCIFKFLFIMCALNVVLAIATILLPI